MSLYSVYEHDAEAPAAIADRFSWFAALLPPVYALVHGLWLGLLGWFVAIALLAGLSLWIGGEASFWLYVAFAALVGFEAPTLRRLKLGRRGWRYRTDLIALDGDLALVDFLRRSRP